MAERVAHGGHGVPDDDIRRRFPRSLHNLLKGDAQTVDHVRCFLNSGETPKLIFVQRGKDRTIMQPALFAHLFSGIY
ncbi:MAG TPA: hypothetical protein DCS88_14435 [Alphaproteobacteria bacterium]|nr:hypothetical protein [Alphaproteobacteria bacterium]